MKDIIIKNTTLKREIIIWFIALFCAVALNIYAIVKYDASWIELLTQLPVIILLSVLIYLLIIVVRGIAKTILKIVALLKK
ncbi:MAG: hypothetical protein A2440_02050 [Stygiobacter sp. RIFOXYC2_FULL_38_25]|nr:MAG: hypothetical protein A2X62_06020 [Stygiobacter sp. GWC2_38_9]OGV07339.1 MAG: hypothetical protein A2299_04505 [Stygiobacter sp. RIFOXYB2_FULL_37_11]OGV10989.1 MAG: hypothetical protein A2237_04005 [Stygiobacter sp. RIFOXYA2_FULL_38_8]OGV15868.1 MAG: hypothetical protein A2440_02050 [Stygiobacter sp. RIFOXYC2_FULL_38_25]OGV80998.1 MAG: hypothetical protein A2X65_07100 [Stygiobacter sp. GWF2_38_21]